MNILFSLNDGNTHQVKIDSILIESTNHWRCVKPSVTLISSEEKQTAIFAKESRSTMDDLDKQISGLLELTRGRLGEQDVGRVGRAISMAMEFHAGQFRKMDGSPYVSHCIEVAYDCLFWGLTDTSAVCAALLHDAVEDAPEHLEPVQRIKRFDAKVYEIVEALSKIRNLQTGGGDLPATYRRILGAAGKDIRVLIIKAFDVYQNAATLEVHNRAKAKNKASLALIYVGAARRLGMMSLADAIIDRILPHLMPVQCMRAQRTLDGLREQCKPSIHLLRKQLDTLIGHKLAKEILIEKRTLADYFYLTENPGTGRLMRVGWPIFRIRILVRNDDTAWRVLGKMHSQFGPMPRHIKDYLNAPRINGFRALTTRILWDGHPVNVHVVRLQDDAANRMGILAEWGVSGPDTTRYMRLLSTLGDSDLRMSEVHAHVLPDLLDIYSPKGDRLTFPVGSVVVDFAYLVHTELGHRCIGAQVNGINRPPEHPLSDGDVVNVLTSKNAVPQRIWLSVVKTARARTLIKQALKDQTTLVIKGVQRDKLDHFKLTSLSGEDLLWSCCCLATPPDPIVGRISEEGRWIVHHKECLKLKATDQWKPGSWGYDRKKQLILRVNFSITNTHGALLPILEILARQVINIHSIQSQGRSSNLNTITLEMSGKLPEVLGRILYELTSVSSVQEVLSYSWRESHS
ncbi:MAG: bifunctional (p)ppGpp synthetase/guanosine-3',5'-bis(diphosphate) 3'-pyrophosphohydrolase [Magnetococcales bacterium]|nr:bifunctional (p)ppGpp synthetase/guanosine-3',5'-bis(diphosphate) 3'-pyrophosphohydrolase [Magnetococcales bacterium]